MPAIVVSTCAAKDAGQKPVPRPRYKVKSPSNVVRGIGGICRNRRTETLVVQERVDSTARTKSASARNKMEELESQVKKKDAEMVSMKRKLNAAQKTLTEKEKALNDLNVKIPKMLADLKKNLLEDESKKRANRDLKESMKRNRNLSGTMKQVEDQLKVKEVKLKDALEDKKKVEIKLKLKEKECREHSHQISNLECRVLELQRKVSSGDVEVAREKEKRTNLEAKHRQLCADNNVREELFEKMETEIFHLSNVAASRENEMERMQTQNSELQSVIQNQEEKLQQMMKEIFEYRRTIISLRSGIGSRKESRGDFVSVTDDIMDRNVSVDLKVTMRNTRRSSSLRGGVISVGESNGSFTASLHTEIIDDVFLDLMEDDESCLGDNSVSTTGCSEYSRPSSGTYRRLEELDLKVQGLWNKLSTKDDLCDDLVHKQAHFNDSVLRLERELDESVVQHSELITKVSVVKRLFE